MGFGIINCITLVDYWSKYIELCGFANKSADEVEVQQK